MSLIKVDGVSKLYRTSEIETMALENVNFTIEKGEFVSVMGPSGCGKSTLLNIVGLLDRPSSGKVDIGFIFQSFHLIQSLSVSDNVELPLIYRGGISGKERSRLVKEVLERVGLSHRAGHYPSQLSGGQCQRVAIARAIIGNPSIILADEPTGNLDSKMSAEIMGILHNLNKEEGRTILMVTHNEEQASETDRVLRFFDGRQITNC